MQRTVTKPDKPDQDRFAEEGFVGPIRVLSPRQCERFLESARGLKDSPPVDWVKGCAISCRAFYELSTHPAIIKPVTRLLGQNVVLWGATVVRKEAGETHPWHSDIESSAPSARTVSVWIGLDHTVGDSSLQIIPRSHRLGPTVQQLRHQLGRGRSELTPEDLVQWAIGQGERTELLQFDMRDGEALIFDGKLWHGSSNTSTETRRALLLQYATPDTPIRIPDLNHLDWPFRQLEVPKPPCLLLRGSDGSGANRIVLAPVPGGGRANPELTSRINPLQIPLPFEGEGWKTFPIFRGTTADLKIASHASVLTHGRCPHPPHTHEEEEILLLLSGEVEIELPDADDDRKRRLTAGDFVYYPTGFRHTLTTISAEPANYLMLKWKSTPPSADPPLGFGQFRAFADGEASDVESGFRPTRLFKGETAYLRKLACHVSTLSPGAGYDSHIDAYDVAMIVLQGEVETLGERAGPYSVIFYRGGEPHAMHNPGKRPARYLVVAFHGSQTGALDDN